MASEPRESDDTEGVPAEGDVLAGKYRVERVIGSGGMGVVVAAMHMILEERVALKFLRPEKLGKEALERFYREARSIAKIKSEHVARVSDVGTLESGAPYMVMEHLDGSDLAAVLRDKKQIPVRDAIEHVIQASEAIAEAHAMGIVHRDLKPANLFLARRAGGTPTIKVLDFGISKLVTREPSSPGDDVSVTRTRAILGSPLYMSPEQMRSSRDVDGRTDIWSLGVILHQLIAGRPPFDSDSFPELCAKILHEAPTPLEFARPDAPPEVCAAIRRCLQKNPADRFQNVGELVLALVEHAPQRARSVAERAVAITELAGLMREASVPRIRLDATNSTARGSAPDDDEEPAAVKGVTSDSVAPMGSREAAVPLVTAKRRMPSRPGDARDLREGKRRRRVPLWLLAPAILLVTAGGSYAWLMHRAGKPWWRFELPLRTASSPPASAEPVPTGPASGVVLAGTAGASSAANAGVHDAGGTVPGVNDAGSAGSLVNDAGSADPSVNDAGAAAAGAKDAGARDAGAVTGTRDAGARTAGKKQKPGAPEGPSPVPGALVVPPGTGELTAERCYQTMPDGSRQPVPCP